MGLLVSSRGTPSPPRPRLLPRWLRTFPVWRPGDRGCLIISGRPQCLRWRRTKEELLNRTQSHSQSSPTPGPSARASWISLQNGGARPGLRYREGRGDTGRTEPPCLPPRSGLWPAHWRCPDPTAYTNLLGPFPANFTSKEVGPRILVQKFTANCQKAI